MHWASLFQKTTQAPVNHWRGKFNNSCNARIKKYWNWGKIGTKCRGNTTHCKINQEVIKPKSRINLDKPYYNWLKLTERSELKLMETMDILKMLTALTLLKALLWKS